ncbi:hypothetical protein LCGC14_2904270, partial [marine sediment metagenome]
VETSEIINGMHIKIYSCGVILLKNALNLSFLNLKTTGLIFFLQLII